MPWVDAARVAIARRPPFSHRRAPPSQAKSSAPRGTHGDVSPGSLPKRLSHIKRRRCHSLDMLLVFGTLTRNDITSHPTALPGAADEYEQLSRNMRTDWVDFATHGAPSWPPYEPPGTRTTRIYSADSTDRPYPEESSRRLWAHHRFDALDLSI